MKKKYDDYRSKLIKFPQIGEYDMLAEMEEAAAMTGEDAMSFCLKGIRMAINESRKKKPRLPDVIPPDILKRRFS